MNERPVKISPLHIVNLLEKEYKAHGTALNYKNEWQLLVSIILSAQCTDARVNLVTPGLFKELPRIEDFNSVPQKKLEKLIFSTGFYKNKARSLKGAAKTIIEEYAGKIPDSMEDLVKIPGVGRKTANVFLHVVHQKVEGVVVDTHIFRVSRRAGASKGKTAEQVEKDIMKSLPKKYWMLYGDLVIQHGRKICHARKPNCAGCVMKNECPSAFKV